MSTLIPFDAIRIATHAQAERLLCDWFPNGKRIGHEFVVGNLQGDAGRSLSVNLRTGKWSDFATGTSGYDLIGLFAQLRHSGNRVAAALELGKMLGIETDRPKPNGAAKQQPSDDNDNWQPIVPPPEGTPPPAATLAGFDIIYDYRGANDQLLHYIGRIEAKDGRRKLFTPVTYGVLNGARGWHKKHPGAPRPLYGLNRIATMPNASVLICEGEKAADAAQEMFPEYACISWQGGTGAVDYADLSPLQGRRNVFIWPDHDVPGVKAAHTLRTKLPQACRLPVNDLPEGSDAADLHVDDPLAWLNERVLAAKQTEADKRRFNLVPFSDIKLMRSPAYLVRDIIPREGLVVVWGPPKCGKTFFVLDLAMHAALGRDYRGHRVDQGPLVYVACEGERGLGARIEAWRQTNPLPRSTTVPFWLLATRLDLPAEHQTLATDISTQTGCERLGAIVIDTLNKTIHGSESKDEDMTSYIRAAETLRERFKCVVIIIHHCGIDDTRARGHTSLLGAVDAQIAVKQINGNIIAIVEYMKDGESGTQIASKLIPVELGQDDDGEIITSCIIEPVVEPVRRSQTPLNGNAETRTRQILADLVATEGQPLPATSGFPSDQTLRGVQESRWRAECDTRRLSASETTQSRTRVFNRNFQILLNRKSVAARNGWVWLVHTKPEGDNP